LAASEGSTVALSISDEPTVMTNVLLFNDTFETVTGSVPASSHEKTAIAARANIERIINFFIR
jgi:hypothetical protein